MTKKTITGPASETDLHRKITAKYIHGDASAELDKLLKKKLTFQLIMTSPPYSINKEYEKHVSNEAFQKEVETVIDKLILLLDPAGSICWQVGTHINKKTKEIVPLDVLYYEIFKRKGMVLRNRIIWHFGHGLHAQRRFSGRYETILWFTRANDYIFNLDSVRVPAKYPGKRYYKGNKKGQLSGNPKGKNPSDFWELNKNEWDAGVWNVPNVNANHREKTIHPCQFPVELVERCVLALTKTDGWVLDPYAGVGSTLIAALKTERNSIGIEKEYTYVKAGKARLTAFKKGKLKIRPIGTPVFVPNQNMAVAKKPDHFLY